MSTEKTASIPSADQLRMSILSREMAQMEQEEKLRAQEGTRAQGLHRKLPDRTRQRRRTRDDPAAGDQRRRQRQVRGDGLQLSL